MKRSLLNAFILSNLIAVSGFAQAPVAGQHPVATQNQQAQFGKISGRLVDGQGKPISYATVTLLRPDNSVAGGDLTKDNGSFSIGPTGGGKFRLRVSAMGFKEKIVEDILITPDAAEKEVGKLALVANATQLKGVEVVAEKRMMEMSVDKKVFNVEKNITTAGGSATDVLSNVPSVSVDVDGGVSLRGKGNVTILIDGKPATLLGGDQASALQSLPASSIASVEVITNPSAKYDAQGMTGIINIITKRDKNFGINGSATLGAGTRDKYNGSLNLNLRNNKWNVFANSNFRLNSNYNRTTTDITRHYNDTATHSYEDNQRKFNGWFNTLGAEYTIDKNNTITLTENLNLMRFGGSGPSTFSLYELPNTPIMSQQRYSEREGGPFSTSTTVDYKHKFKKEKQELTASANYTKSWMTMTQSYVTDTVNATDGSVSGKYLQNSPSTGSRSNLFSQVDFTTPLLTKNGKMDLGAKEQIFWFESSNNATITDPLGSIKVDNLLLNSYRYRQEIYAAYANYSDQIGLFSYQAGLRLEDARYNGTTLSLNGKNYSNEYLNLFPSVFVSYKLPKDQSVYMNYSRRTNRPDFFSLMPYVDISNSQEHSSGNPDLRPEFINNVELSYNRQFKKGHNLIASVYYQYTENLINQYRLYDTATGITNTKPMNLSSGVTYGAELIGRAQILPIWDATLSFNFFQSQINGSNIDPSMNNSGNSWMTKLNTNLRLPAGFSLQVNGNYESPKVAGQGRLQEAYWMDVAVRKNFWKNKATLVFNVSDIFNTRKYTTIYDLPLYYQSTYRDRETRIGNITFTWRFGKSDIKSGGGQDGGRRKKGKEGDKIQEKDRNSNLKGEEGNDQGGGNGGM